MGFISDLARDWSQSKRSAGYISLIISTLESF